MARQSSLLLLTTLAALLGGCATTYDPPGPGKHFSPGEARAGIICGYETQTSTRLSAWRCIKREDLQAQGDTARREADALRTPVPVIN